MQAGGIVWRMNNGIIAAPRLVGMTTVQGFEETFAGKIQVLGPSPNAFYLHAHMLIRVPSRFPMNIPFF